ncbi:SOS response-associated peptidase [Staphylococcus chromogenes]|nr:SOS response-associated peptidase [Staphylococcus chromogenes]
MCGRFVLFTTAEALIQATGQLIDAPGRALHAPVGTPGPRYNIAPTQVIPIVRFNSPSEAVLEPARWGLLPHWKKDLDGPPLFNARAETVQSKPSFRDAFKRGRCLIPLDGYYEWKDKQPYFVSRDDAALLWATGLDQLSCTMVTTDAPEPMEQLHHRLPRFLSADEVEQWLLGEPDEAAELLHPSQSSLVEHLRIRPADKAVGNVRNDYPELISQ